MSRLPISLLVLVVGSGLLIAAPARAGELLFAVGGSAQSEGGPPVFGANFDTNVAYGMDSWAARPAIQEHLALATWQAPGQDALLSVSTLGAQMTLSPHLSAWAGLGLAFTRFGESGLAADLSLNVALTHGPVPLGILLNAGGMVDGPRWAGAAFSARFWPPG